MKMRSWNFKALSPFEDILEMESLIPDKRLVWNDSALFVLIAKEL